MKLLDINSMFLVDLMIRILPVQEILCSLRHATRARLASQFGHRSGHYRGSKADPDMPDAAPSR
jgi:hypothetical protein